MSKIFDCDVLSIVVSVSVFSFIILVYVVFRNNRFFPWQNTLEFFLKFVSFLFLCAFAKLRKVNISFVVSVCPSVRMKQLGSHWTDFDETLHLSFSENLLRKFKFHKNPTRITGTLHEDFLHL